MLVTQPLWPTSSPRRVSVSVIAMYAVGETLQLAGLLSGLEMNPADRKRGRKRLGKRLEWQWLRLCSRAGPHAASMMLRSKHHAAPIIEFFLVTTNILHAMAPYSSLEQGSISRCLNHRGWKGRYCHMCPLTATCCHAA
jgi:hypothetical protein